MIALEETETEVGSCSARKTDRVPGKSRGAVRAVSTKMRRRKGNLFTSRKIAKGARCEKRTRACCVEDAFLWRACLVMNARACGDVSLVCRARRDCPVIMAFASARHTNADTAVLAELKATLRHLQRIFGTTQHAGRL